MTSAAPEYVEARPPTGTALTVLVAEQDAEFLGAISEELTRRSFVVIPVTSWSAALAVLAEHPVHLGVVQGSLADMSGLVSRQSGTARSADRNDDGSEMPFIFTIADTTTFDWDSYALLGSADYVMEPVLPADLGRRVSALASRLKRHARASLDAEQLRAAVRRVSDAVQSTNEPAAMGALLVSGAAGVFDLARVHFATFDDERVPRLGHQQLNGQPSPSILDLGEHEASVRELAIRLWRTGESGDTAEISSDSTSVGYPELTRWEAAHGAHTSLALPLGNGSTAFGLLWATATGDRRAWSSMEVSLLRHLAGVAAQALMQARIITGQREVLKRLQRLDAAKSNFLRTVNHELRTPLTSMTAYLDLLRDGTGGGLPPAAVNMLTVVERNAQRLGLLIDDILTISRMTADPQVVWEPVDISQLVSGVVQALSAAATHKDIRLEVKHIPSHLMVEGDPARLRQVVRNVTDNAIKFTPGGGRVEVDVAHCVLDGQVAAVNVVVADTGEGVSADDLPELFTSFFRGANAEAGAVSGSGLGLAIVRGVVDSHGGAIEVSETAGGGTTISVQLPLRRRPG